MQTLINLAYIAAAILFIFGIKMLGRPETARRGNMVSAIGMLLAIVVTLLNQNILSYTWIIAGLLIGAAIGAFAAKKVAMTGMPELVALFNGFGGLASLLVAWAEYDRVLSTPPDVEIGAVALGGAGFFAFVTSLAVLIGGTTFTGSLIAYGKLSGKISGAPKTLPKQKLLNAVLALVIVACFAVFIGQLDTTVGYIALIFVIIGAFKLGVFGTLPIGGGDMPVVIALLNSLSGLAASAAGFVIGNNVLIVAGCLVGASGLILTVIMCKAMNRTLRNVLFAGFGAAEGTQSADSGGELKPITVDDAFYILEAAKSVVVIPGYGMAVAQAQHAVKELGVLLEDNGAEVRYAIHPVAGRMPGHMNVLLAEADVPYEQLVEMDDVNPNMETVDVAIVIGANDVVNPAAAEDESSPIYGMPIIRAHAARTCFCLKRGKGAGFSGLENKLFTAENTRMLYGDAKATVSGLVSQFKEG